MPPAWSPTPPPPAPPYAPGACDVWEGRCIRAGAVLGPQFYAFLAIFILGAALLALNLRNIIQTARSNDRGAENQALTAVYPVSDQRLRALRPSQGCVVPAACSDILRDRLGCATDLKAEVGKRAERPQRRADSALRADLKASRNGSDVTGNVSTFVAATPV